MASGSTNLILNKDSSRGVTSSSAVSNESRIFPTEPLSSPVIMILILPGNPIASGFPLLISEQETKVKKIRTKQNLLSMAGGNSASKLQKKVAGRGLFNQKLLSRGDFTV
jgi:hypothetical protein